MIMEMKRMAIIGLVLCVLSITSATCAWAEDGDRIAYYPLAQYEQLFLENRPVMSPSVGIIAQTAESDDFLGVLIYTAHFYGGGLEADYPDLSHAVNGFFDAKSGRHEWLGVFKSESDEPVVGGLATFTIGGVYGYEVVSREGLSVVLGGGLAVGDFGLEFPDGSAVPVIPIPLIRVASESRWLQAKFEFLTGPNLSLVFMPRSLFRLAGEMRMDRFEDKRDVIFDASVGYRPFAPRGKDEDFAGVSVGISNSEIAFDRTDDFYRLQYYSGYAKIDLTILQASVGYAFSSSEMYGDDIELDPGRGMFFSIQGILPLGK